MKTETDSGNAVAINAEKNETEDYYIRLDLVFSKASGVYDSKILSNFVNVNIRDMELKILSRYAGGAENILEIGCGTGEESKRFIHETGKSLQCIDIASGMVAFSREKMRKAGLADKFGATRLAASKLIKMEKKFELVYSFNGAFNTEPDKDSLLKSLSLSMPKGSVIVFSLRNKKCLGEYLLYTLTGRTSELKKRRSGVVQVDVVGEKIGSTYYSKKEILSLFGKDFKLLAIYGLGIVIPPYMAEKVRSSLLKSIITKFDRFFSVLPVFRTLGDETAYVMERK